MKCLILAGGSGNRLWPLSRNNYPKQFINLEDNHSLLQETIVRNMPYCEEFIIFTNHKYNFIIEGQLQAFQGLKYRCIYEDIPIKTAAAIALTSFLCNPSELIFVVTADHLIEGNGYREAVLQAKKAAKKGWLVALGLKALSAHTGYGYIETSDSSENICTHFHEKPDIVTAQKYYNSGNYLWNSGLYLFQAGDFLHDLSETAPTLYNTCKKIIKENHFRGSSIIFTEHQLKEVPTINVEKAVFEKTHNLKVIPADFSWLDVSELESLDEHITESDSHDILQYNATNTTIINQASNHLVVANDVNDLMIINTVDATYVAKKGSTYQIKDIIKNNYHNYQRFFDDNILSYRAWGTYEVLKEQEHYKVKKVTIFPGKSLLLHKHKHRSEHWSIVQGTATITLEESTKVYSKNDSVYVPIGMMHQVANYGNEELIIIEIAIGETVLESDTESYTTTSTPLSSAELIKLTPAFKDYLWGGTKLRDEYNKKCDYDIIAESWELSAHPSGESVVASGQYCGMRFSDYLSKIAPNCLGWKCKTYDTFPLLIKFIDAKQSLSVQVHPDDEYALRVEKEYGKNEMWYIIDCEPDAYLYYGFNKDVTKKEVIEHVNSNTLTDLLNKVPVKKGDVFFVDAGTVHAIGPGVLICEIQQSSNSTYRLYDYGRKDKYGNTRELHLDKALAVLNYKKTNPTEKNRHKTDFFSNYTSTLLGKCKYFESIKYNVHTEIVLNSNSTSFLSLIIISGSGNLISPGSLVSFKSGDSFFVPADYGDIKISGSCEFILSHI